MDKYEKDISPDFFLRDIPNVKISQENKKAIPKKQFKEEIKVLNLSENSQQMVMETLRFIHGPDYCLDDASKYEDKQVNVNKSLQQNNLVVKGGFFHADTSTVSQSDKLKIFALIKLESYGFHKNHCIEAYEYSNGDIENALYLLYSKYMGIDDSKVECDISETELIEQRNDEKGVLESIYESIFEEKIPNMVWLFKLKLDYLVNIFHPKILNKPQVIKTKKKKDMCRGFLGGNCKFGNKCRFSHELEKDIEPINLHLNDYIFELEIIFPNNTKYPFEAPVIFLKTNLSLPEFMNLHICKRLHDEARILAQDGICSIYSLVELLKNEEIIVDHVKNTKIRFLLSIEKLFPSDNDIKDRINIDKYHQKGVLNKDNKKETTMEQILQEDRRLSQKFILKEKESQYQKMMEIRKKLPAWNLRNNIINTIQSSHVTVISGETGCGKSTQVPQFLLDEWLSNYKNCNKHVEIVCTQPRRISTIGVAQRVAEERNERVGNVVGYQIRLENKVSSSTRLTFCTTGILLRRLEGDPMLSTVSHIIVDEVHERSEDSDFLLLILKNLMEVRNDLKVILMSATLNADLFSNYFGAVPVLEIPGRTFPVEQYYLEDILDTTGYILEENTQYTRRLTNCNKNLAELELELQLDVSNVSNSAMPKNSLQDNQLTISQMVARYKDYNFKTCKNLYLMDHDKINMDLIEAVLEWITSGSHEYPHEGSILIFLPGIAEITLLYDNLINHSEFSPRHEKYVILPLHSSLSAEEQSAIFKKPKNGARKIILSTNLAETSITIDDCVFVIDCGKMKEKRFDSNRNMEMLDTVWVTRANALQRKGRAGRIMPGVCIHLFTNYRFKYHMLSEPIPEIHRVPLEQLLLHIKILPNFKNSDLYQVLDSILEPPVKDNIDSAIRRLQDVGAFDKENNLTPLGHHLAALPVDVRIGKLMLYGAIFSCVDASLTMAASLSYKNPFVTPFGKREEAMAKKKEFAVGHSDHLTVLRAYKRWQEISNKSWLAGKNFANENYLSLKTLEMLADIKYQFLELLVSIGFVPINLGSYKHRSSQDKVLSLTGTDINKNGENVRLLMSILCAALYPNIVKVFSPQAVFLRSSAGAVPVTHEVKELKFQTQQEEVFLHPSSVNYSVTNYLSPYLVFQEKLRTSRIFIRDCSMVPIIPLVLFSGSTVDICVNNGNTFITLANGWINFHVQDHKVAEMIKGIHLELLDLLDEKIKNPLLNLLHSEKGERIINTIVHIATND